MLPAGGTAGGSSSPVTCRDYFFPVTMSQDDPTTYRVYGELCARGRLTARTPVQVLLHGGTYDHAYWDWPYRPDIYSYVQQATRQGFATLTSTGWVTDTATGPTRTPAAGRSSRSSWSSCAATGATTTAHCPDRRG